MLPKTCLQPDRQDISNCKTSLEFLYERSLQQEYISFRNKNCQHHLSTLLPFCFSVTSVHVISPIDQDIRPRHEPAPLSRQIHHQPIQIILRPQPIHWCPIPPDLLLALELLGTIQRRIHIAGADAIDADTVLGPLGAHRFGHLNHARLGGIVRALLLRVVDDAAGHRRDEDDAAVLGPTGRGFRVAGQFALALSLVGAVGVGGLDHVFADGAGDAKGADEVDFQGFLEGLGAVGLGGPVGEGDTRRVDEHVDGAEFLDDLAHGGVDFALVDHIDVVVFDGDFGGLGELLGHLLAQEWLDVEDGDGFDAGFAQGLGHVETETSSTTGNVSGILEVRKSGLPGHDGDFIHGHESRHGRC